MRKLLIVLAAIICASCSTYNQRFFSGLGIEDINNTHSIHYEYKKSNIDSKFPQVGYIEEPIIDFTIKYDTAKKYSIILYGDLIFHKDSCGLWDSSQIDSVNIVRLIFVTKEIGTKSEIFDTNHPIDFHTFPIPKQILNSVRNDFLIRMKETKFHAGKINSKGHSWGHIYFLY